MFQVEPSKSHTQRASLLIRASFLVDNYVPFNVNL